MHTQKNMRGRSQTFPAFRLYAAKQLVTPMAVAMAVSTLIAIWMMSLHVSFVIAQSSFLALVLFLLTVSLRRRTLILAQPLGQRRVGQSSLLVQFRAAEVAGGDGRQADGLHVSA